MRSTIKISLTAVLALALVLVLVTLLNVFKFESALAEITHAKVDVIVDDVEQSIEAAMDLGLPLAGIGMGNDILARAKARDPRIIDAIIFGRDGEVLFASRQSSGAAAIDGGWLQAQALSGNTGRWSVAGDEQTVYGRRLDSSYAAGVGGVAFVYSDAEDEARSAAVRDGLVRNALIAFVGFGALSVLATIVALRGMRRMIAGLVRSLAGRGDAAALPADLVSSIRGFQGSVEEAEHEIVRAGAPAAGGVP